MTDNKGISKINNKFSNLSQYSNDLMRITCNGICTKYKARKPLQGDKYPAGQKRWNRYGIFIEWDGLFCPCCNMKLRLAPRYTKYKEKFLNSYGI